MAWMNGRLGFCLQAITPPETIAPSHGPSSMPTAAAVAIAATTAKIQAMDAQQQPAGLVSAAVFFCFMFAFAQVK